MIEYDEDRTSVVDTAIMNELGCKEEIDLYSELSITLELIDDEFTIVNSGIDNGIHFGISTNFPNGLPEKIGIMIFNIEACFNVNIKETSEFVYDRKRYFEIKIKKE